MIRLPSFLWRPDLHARGGEAPIAGKGTPKPRFPPSTVCVSSSVVTGIPPPMSCCEQHCESQRAPPPFSFLFCHTPLEPSSLLPGIPAAAAGAARWTALAPRISMGRFPRLLHCLYINTNILFCLFCLLGANKAVKFFFTPNAALRAINQWVVFG